MSLSDPLSDPLSEPSFDLTGVPLASAPDAEPGGSGRHVSSVAAAPPDSDQARAGLHTLLISAVELGASDLHLTAGVAPTVRINGDLEPLEGTSRLLPDQTARMAAAILSPGQRAQFARDLDLDLAYAVDGVSRFRVNVYQQRGSTGLAFRVIPSDIRDLDTLGLPPSVAQFAQLKRGLVLITGPTGSGKSTTCASLLHRANHTRSGHIVTIEDPIEFVHQHGRCVVNQREVGTDTRDFSTALRHALRQDPDIILVGELRDLETTAIAVSAAETGHLVFATLHTRSAAATVDRLIDIFPAGQQQQVRTQLAGCLAGVVSQSLAPTSDGKGRSVVAEVMVATPAIRNLVREAKVHQIPTSMQASGDVGMVTFDQDLARQFQRGRISLETALELAHQPDEFERLTRW